MRPFASLAILALLCSCAAPTGRNESLEANLNTWNGAHIDALVSSWGPPTSRHKFSDGHEVVAWTRTAQSVQHNVRGSVRDVIQYACTTTFQVDPKGKVRWDRYDGC